VDNNASTEPALLPTALERRGDFSQTLDGFGRPVRVIDPATGLPFPGNTIPRDRISPQAAALLAYYPDPNIDGTGYNYQTPVVTTTRTDNVQSRLQRQLTQRDGFVASFSFQRTTTDSTSLLGFDNSRENRGVNADGTFSHRFSPFVTTRARYQFTRQVNEANPYFANRINVSGDAGIAGNNQDPINWGPPTLSFASGIERLADTQSSFLKTLTHGWSSESFVGRGRHSLTLGGGVRRHAIDIRSQQDPRGAFTFTGAYSGFDFADFLLGIPATSSIAFGNTDKFFRGFSYDAYITDDWRVSPGLTVNAGVRWEYESPFVEQRGRLVNLDIASGFSGIAPVLADNPVGALTGADYPESLVRPDKRGIQPRVGVAWRPIPGSSLVVRGGYGIYRNTNVYQSIATLMAQQPPLSTSFSVQNSAAQPLTLANGFVAPGGFAPNTFAVDPDFRVGYAHNWQASVQRDLPASLTVLATYLGTKGSHLMQEILPNTYPVGAVNPCASCPAGYVFLTSNGSSSRHAGQVQLRRRLRNGLTATVQYTLAKAEDNAAAFLGATLSGSAIAQNWLDLDAEQAPSNFDQRHQVTAQFQYTTGVGVTGGALVGGIAGSLLRGWTITSQLTAGSGLPVTPLHLAAVPGTGFTGTIRAGLTGAPVDAIPSGLYANPAAYGPPAPGSWGDAGRNSITGPSQFTMNAGIRRTFPWGARMNLEWGLDATNVLNRVSYRSVNVLAGSPQFGLPVGTNNPRKIQSVLRFRF
jgi:outer membrane receptor protein involved in Fe transport